MCNDANKCRAGDDRVDEALALTPVRSKREVIHLALQELVQRRKAKDLLDLAGKIQLTEDYDYKRARGLGRDSASDPVPAIAARAVPAKNPPLLEREAQRAVRRADQEAAARRAAEAEIARLKALLRQQ